METDLSFPRARHYSTYSTWCTSFSAQNNPTKSVLLFHFAGGVEMQELSNVPRMTGSSGTWAFWLQSIGTMLFPPCAMTLQTGRNHFQIVRSFVECNGI